MAVVFSVFVATKTYPISNAFDTVSKAAFLCILSWRVIRSTEKGANFILDRWVFQQTEEGKNLSANFHKGLRLCLYSAGAVFVLDNCGLNISSLVAGFGIGGLAIALAAQAILGDTIASVTMFIDRPFVVGDAVAVNGFTGVIERIGFKTTRIRSLSGELIIFPNSTISSATLQNFSRADHVNQSVEIGVDVDTSNEMIRKLPGILMGALQDKSGFEPVEVYFKGFGSSSLTFEIRYRVNSSNTSDIRAAKSEVNTT